MNYLKAYFKLIDSRSNLTREGYLETHHIVPKSIYGKELMDESRSASVNHPNNLIKLTAREHFIAHWLLHRAFDKNRKLQGAFWAMCMISPSQKRGYTPSSRAFNEAREAHAASLRKSVAMYSLDGRLLDCFNSITEASEEMRLTDNAIGQAANGHSNSCGGFQWAFYDMSPKKHIANYIEILGNTVQVAQFNLMGNLIKKYESYEDAERVSGIASSTIRASIHRNSKPKSVDYFFRSFEKQLNIPDKINEYIAPCSSDSFPVVMLSADYTYFIKRFKCIKYAKAFLGKTGREQISRVCNDMRNTSHGYGWMWESDYDLGLPKRDFSEVLLYEHSKYINCYNLDGVYLETFKSLTDASISLGVSNISRSATKPYGTSGNYQFRFTNSANSKMNIEKAPLLKNEVKTIFKLDPLSNRIIEEFNSLAEAALSTGNIDNRFNISRCAKGERKTAYGFCWFFMR